ncbi:ABC transporter ATP-binding protein [Candidatus Woesebacteria bacterium]|nr:ABC transporter ATP-binding protein [Candidatus Woesebacteria bacterium]
MNNNLAIEIKNLSKEFVLPHHRRKTLKETIVNKFHKKNINKISAIDNLSIDIKTGEFLGIIGPNGAGKSTLLKIISGIYLPSSGTVVVNGSLASFIELRVGFQKDLTAKDNIFLYGALLGLTRNEVKNSYDKIINFAELQRFMDQKYKYFSSGMQLRLGFAITSHVNKDILLVDEALSVGDESFQKKCLVKMHNLHKKGKTIILVSHNLNMIEKNCTRAIYMKEGTLESVGKPKKVIAKYLRSDNTL